MKRSDEIDSLKPPYTLMKAWLRFWIWALLMWPLAVLIVRFRSSESSGLMTELLLTAPVVLFAPLFGAFIIITNIKHYKKDPYALSPERYGFLSASNHFDLMELTRSISGITDLKKEKADSTELIVTFSPPSSSSIQIPWNSSDSSQYRIRALKVRTKSQQQAIALEVSQVPIAQIGDKMGKALLDLYLSKAQALRMGDILPISEIELS